MMVTAMIGMMLTLVLVLVKTIPMFRANDVTGVIILSIFYFVVNVIFLVIKFVCFEKGYRAAFINFLGIAGMFYAFFFTIWFMTELKVFAIFMVILVVGVSFFGIPIVWPDYKK